MKSTIISRTPDHVTSMGFGIWDSYWVRESWGGQE